MISSLAPENTNQRKGYSQEKDENDNVSKLQRAGNHALAWGASWLFGHFGTVRVRGRTAGSLKIAVLLFVFFQGEKGYPQNRTPRRRNKFSAHMLSSPGNCPQPLLPLHPFCHHGAEARVCALIDEEDNSANFPAKPAKMLCLLSCICKLMHISDFL